MPRLAPLLAALLLAALPAGAASAATLGDPQVGFSADRTLQLDGRTYIGKIWAMPGEERHEQAIASFRPIFLLRAGNPLGEVVLPELKTVVQFVIPPELRVLLDRRDLATRPIGKATVNGVATTVYAVDESMPEGRALGTLWLSRDGIPMRLAGTFTGKRGKPTRVRWELSHLKIASQPAALFEAPHDYARLPAEAVAPLLGLKLKSAKHQ
jgi:hypothetical protein